MFQAFVHHPMWTGSTASRGFHHEHGQAPDLRVGHRREDDMEEGQGGAPQCMPMLRGISTVRVPRWK